MKKVPAHSRAEIVRRKKREKISGISANRNTQAILGTEANQEPRFAKLLQLLMGTPDQVMSEQKLKNNHNFTAAELDRFLTEHDDQIERVKRQPPGGGRPSYAIKLRVVEGGRQAN